MFVPPKNETKNNIPADAWYFSRTEIDSTNFTNGKLTTKVRRKKAENSYVFKKNIPKDLEIDETTKQNKYLKKIFDKEINKIKQLKTSGYLDTKDQDKINYMSVPAKNETRKQYCCRCWAFFKNRK